MGQGFDPLHRYRRFALTGVLILAAVLRLRGLGHQSFWYDESLTLESARAPFGSVIETIVRLENMPPGHFVILNLWERVFGDSEFSLRLPSAIAGIGAVLMIYLLGRRLLRDGRSGETAGLFAGLFLAVSRYHIAYSQEARSYSLMFFLALVSCYLFVMLLTEPRRWAQAAYVISGGAMLWVHPFSVFVLLAQTLFLGGLWLYRWRTCPGELELPVGLPLRRWIILQGAAVLLFGPWLGYMLHVAAVGEPWLQRPRLGDAILAYADSVPSLIGLGCLAAVALWNGVRHRAVAVFFALLLCVLPVGIPVALSLGKHPIFTPRYGIAMLIGLYLLAGYGAAMVGCRWGAIAALAVCLTGLPHLAGDFRQGVNAQDKPATRDAAAYLTAAAAPGDGLYCPDIYTARPFSFYFARKDLVPMESLAAIDSNSSAVSAVSERIWLLFPSATSATLPYMDPVAPMLTGTRYGVVSRHEFHGVLLVELHAATP